MRNVAITKWILQRVTAVILLPLLIWFLSVFIGLVQKDFKTIIIFFENNINFSLSFVFLVIVFSNSKWGWEKSLKIIYKIADTKVSQI